MCWGAVERSTARGAREFLTRDTFCFLVKAGDVAAEVKKKLDKKEKKRLKKKRKSEALSTGGGDEEEAEEEGVTPKKAKSNGDASSQVSVVVRCELV